MNELIAHEVAYEDGYIGGYNNASEEFLELIFKITKDGNSITVRKGFKDGIEIIFSDCDNFRHKASFFTYDELKILDVHLSCFVEKLYDDFLHELIA